MLTTTPSLTSEEFRAYENAPENADRRFELIAGEIVEMPSAVLLHSIVVARIVGLFVIYLLNNDIGYVVGDNQDFHLAPDHIYRPDVAFISRARLPRLPRYMSGAPDLAVEVVSPSNRPAALERKIDAYLRYGAQAVWLVYPEEKAVRVYQRGAEGEISYRRLGAEEEIDGGTTLPGFRAVVGTFFPAVEVEAEQETD